MEVEGLVLAVFNKGKVLFTFYETKLLSTPDSWTFKQAQEIELTPGIHVPESWEEGEYIVSIVAVTKLQHKSMIRSEIEKFAKAAGVEIYDSNKVAVAK